MENLSNNVDRPGRVPAMLAMSHFRGLDGMRALSIGFVMAAHFFLYEEASLAKRILKGGGLGVEVFFVISGFLITSLLLKEKARTGGISLRNFYLRRFFRIIPVAYLYLICLVLLDHFFALGITGRNYAHLFTFTENFNTMGHPLGHHYWSLSVEEQFYLLFPFFLKRGVRGYTIMALIIIFLAPVIRIADLHYFEEKNMAVAFLDGFLNQGLLAILVGSLTSILIFRMDPQPRPSTPMASLLQLVALVAVWVIADHPKFGGSNMLLADLCIVWVIVANLLYDRTWLCRILEWRPVRFIGVLSYSLYIWQQLFLFDPPWQGVSPVIDSMPFKLAAILAVATLSYHTYEKRFLKIKKRFSPNGTAS